MHPPLLSHFKVFGCLCYVVSPTVDEKFSSRAIPEVFMGYPSTQKVYILFDLHAYSFFENRHVVFQESLLPFKHMHTSSNPIFPVLKLGPPLWFMLNLICSM